MQFDHEKLKALVLYACSSCEPSQLGATKLHKVLYFSDMITYAESGRPLTGATYRKSPYGPTCDALLQVLRELERAGSLEIAKARFHGFVKHEYRPRIEADLSRFSTDERATVDDVIDLVCRNNTARSISELSHNQAWEMAEFGEVLPYESAFYMFPSQVSQEALEWAEGEAAKVESARSSADALGLEDYSAFRSRVRARVSRSSA